MTAIALIPFLILIIAMVVLLITTMVRSKSSIEIMLLGIAIILTGGVIAVDDSSNLGGVEYIIVLLGLAFAIAGFVKKKRE